MDSGVFNRFFNGEPGDNVKLKVKGIGNSQAVGHVCATIFIECTDGALLELDAEFHIMDDFDMGICLGIDVMNAYGIDCVNTEKLAKVPSVEKAFDIEFSRLPHQDRLIPVKAKERTRVKRDCHRHVELDMDLEQGRDYVFEPTLLSRPGHGFMKCPGSIISSSTKFLPLTNFSTVTESVSKGRVLGYARPVSKNAAVSVVGHVDHSNENIPVGDLKDEFTPPVIHREPELLNKGTDISEFCLVGDPQLPADMIDPSDRDPEPHLQGPTWKEFDIARNADANPTQNLFRS